MADRMFPDGAQVQLNSGGPVMTVEDYAEYDDGWLYRCKWYDERTNDFKSDRFKEAMLRRVD